MTNEEAKKILSGYVKACNEDDFLTLEMFEYEEVIEAMTMGAKALSKPSLPSNLDEAAYNRVTENGRFKVTDFEKMRMDDIAFGAEWMAGQFQKIEGELVDWYSTSDGKEYCCGVKTNDAFEVPEGFYIKKK